MVSRLTVGVAVASVGFVSQTHYNPSFFNEISNDATQISIQLLLLILIFLTDQRTIAYFLFVL